MFSLWKIHFTTRQWGKFLDSHSHTVMYMHGVYYLFVCCRTNHMVSGLEEWQQCGTDGGHAWRIDDASSTTFQLTDRCLRRLTRRVTQTNVGPTTLHRWTNYHLKTVWLWDTGTCCLTVTHWRQFSSLISRRTIYNCNLQNSQYVPTGLPVDV